MYESVNIKSSEIKKILLMKDISTNPLSPLNQFQEVAESLSEEGQKLNKQEGFIKMLEIVATPVSVITNRIGGGLVPYEEMFVCHRKISGDILVSIQKVDKEYVALQQWNSKEEYISWWCTNFACKNDDPIQNYITPMISLEAFMTILHAIDACRRAVYHTLLNYTPYEMPKLEVSEFTESAKKSVKSMDVRWLLPAFVTLCPGISEYQTKDLVESMQEAYFRNFLTTVKEKETGKEWIGFGEAGLNMGMEFLTGFAAGSGFEHKALTSAGLVVKSRFFIAITGLCNHVINLVGQENGAALVNHQPMNKEKTEAFMKSLWK